MTSRTDPRALPTGTVTFMFTDIEGSTNLLNRLGDAEFARVLADHHRLIRAGLDEGGGVEVSTEGDSFFAVFTDPIAAVVASAGIQKSLADGLVVDGQAVLVRCGVHTGVGVVGGDNYTGVDVHKASRVAAAAHGGQILVSDVTAQLVRGRLPSDLETIHLGRFRLEGFTQSESIHQVNAVGLRQEFPTPAAPPAVSRLPMPLTEFVGRGRELAQGLAALAKHRLLTLTGPGGTGKTRLAVELAGRAEPTFADGAVFVSMATISDPGLIAVTILDALELKTAGGVDPDDHIRRYLADREILLVLDNMEQLSSGVANLARLIAESPGLKVIATSRTPLRISGEREFPVAPLEVPDEGATPDRVAEVAGVKLFVSRAAAVRPGFEVNADNASTVAGIARSLDGLPLAIELAASRMRTLTPDLIYERLGNQLLSAPSSDLPARQQTMVNAIGWSYDLLTESVRILFEQLSVFSGGFGLTEAELVCEAHGDVLEGLVELVEQSLVRQTETAGEPRFRMLTVIREFGYGALVARGDEQSVLDAHSRVYMEMAERAAEEILTSKQESWLRRLATDHDNIRAAFDRVVADEDHEKALRIAAAMWRLWQIRGLLDEGQHRLETALALPGEHDPVLRARALIGLGGILYWKGLWEDTSPRYQEALDLYEGIGDDMGIADSLYNLSFSKGYSQDFEGGKALLEDAIARSDRIGWRIGVARAQWGLASIAAFTDDWDASLAAAASAIEEFEKHDAPFDLGWAWFMVANAQVRKGDPDAAWDPIVRAVRIFGGVQDLSALPLIYDLLAYVLLLKGNHRDAAWFAGATRRIQEDTGVEIAVVEVNQVPELLEFVSRLDPDEQAEFDRGHDASNDEAIARALALSG